MGVDLTDCLPAELRAPTTTIAPIGAGMSTAAVYRVEATGTTYVLKVARDDEPIAAWRTRVAIQRAAAAAGVAPAIVHADEDRRAVVSEFIADRGAAALFADPRTRDASIALLGKTLRTVHDLPAPLDAERRDPRQLLAMLQGVLGSVELPAFARAAIADTLAAEPPPTDRAPALSHNDVNPTNLAYDGERLVLLDWDTADVHEPLYDLAAIAMFLRFEDAACAALLAAHDGAPVTEPPAELPARFTYDRRFVAVMCGAAFLHLARAAGHPGDATGDGPALVDFYQQLRAGALSLGTPAGRWAFGLALMKSA